jgi:hypothetical protein
MSLSLLHRKIFSPLVLFFALSVVIPVFHQHSHASMPAHIHSDGRHIDSVSLSIIDGNRSFAHDPGHEGPHMHLKKDFAGLKNSCELQKQTKEISFGSPFNLVFHCGTGRGYFPAYGKIVPLDAFINYYSGLSPPCL